MYAGRGTPSFCLAPGLCCKINKKDCTVSYENEMYLVSGSWEITGGCTGCEAAGQRESMMAPPLVPMSCATGAWTRCFQSGRIGHRYTSRDQQAAGFERVLV